MKNIKNLFLTLFVLFVLVFSGCGAEDCSVKDTTYEKYSWNDETKVCEISKKIDKDVCGNGIAEDDETYCNCPKDVDKEHPEFGCDGTIGDYLEQSCNVLEECVLSQNDKVVEEVKSLEFKNSDLTIEARVKYGAPFILHTDEENKLEFDVSLFTTNAALGIKNLKVEELKIMDSSRALIGSVEYNEGLSSVGDSLTLKKVGLSDTKEYEISQTLRLEMVVSYDRESLDRDGVTVLKTEPRKETFVASLPKFVIINPNFAD